MLLNKETKQNLKMNMFLDIEKNSTETNGFHRHLTPVGQLQKYILKLKRTTSLWK